MTNLENLNKQIKLDALKIEHAKAKIAEARTALQDARNELKKAKADRKVHKSELKTAKKLDIVEQALKDLRSK